MGYLTKYELELEINCDDQEILNQIHYFMKNNSDNYYGLGDDNYTWYNHEEEMKKLSVKFPNILFTLYGEGEEAGDIWYKYFKNGKMQACYV